MRVDRREEPDRSIDEEDPVPADRLRDDTADQQADRAARRGDEGVDPHRLGLLPRLREHRHDHAQDNGRGHRAADALEEPRADQHRLALREAAEHRGDDEDGQAVEQDRPAADQIAQPPGEQQQPAERDQVGIHDPREARLREAQIVLDRGQGDVHDGDVEDDHQHADAEHVQRDPPVAVAGDARGLRRRSRGATRFMLLRSHLCLRHLNLPPAHVFSRFQLRPPPPPELIGFVAVRPRSKSSDREAQSSSRAGSPKRS